MSIAGIQQQANYFINQAIKLDHAGDGPGAVQNYLKGIELLMKGSFRKKNEERISRVLKSELSNSFSW